MKYIHHDTSAIDDDKLAELVIKTGYEGYGLFWATIEKLGKQEKPVKTDVLKKQLKVGKKLERIWAMMEKLGLIETHDGETFNNNVMEYAGKYQTKKKQGAERIANWRAKKAPVQPATGKPQQLFTPPGNLLEKQYKDLAKSKANILDFIKQHRPEFIEPYIDIWNLFADQNKLAKVKAATETRKRKLRVRLKDKNFNFSEILRHANNSEFLLTNGKWFGFDWIVDNDSNYLKVVEGNYQKSENIKNEQQTIDKAAERLEKAMGEAS